MDKNTAPFPADGNGKIGNDVSSIEDPGILEHQVLQNTMGIRKNYKRAANRGKKGSQVPCRSYTLRSSESNVRALRSNSSSKTTEPVQTSVQPGAKSSKATRAEPEQSSVQPAAKRRKRGRPSKKSSDKTPTDEFSQIRKRVRYILNRMNYEQSLIEAYASEGWKNQSLDKIRPEKELERAKAEILRCKSRIREVFQNLDSLLCKGKIDETLFDSEGEISCEDIFCATCGSKAVTLNNDIILCDGVCDRAFHQNCLNPPLLTEDIPTGDEGWLCPACDCKIDCIDIINELQGSELSIGDSWEKVFPEAAASANGSMLDGAFDLPSDDSEDNDFDPNMAEDHAASKEKESSEEDEDGGSDSDDSNFVTSSDDSESLMEKKKVDDLGLPSEDSEDDDYDPAGPDSDEDVKKKKSSSDESDFSSDSDDFCKEIAKSSVCDEVSTPPVPNANAGDTANDMEKRTAQANTADSNLNCMDTEMDQNVVLPVSARRQAERLDYKKLYDEAYGNASSDSSDDEEWSGKSTPGKGNAGGEADSSAGKGSRQTRIVHRRDELSPQRVRKSSHPDTLHSSVGQKHEDLTTPNGSGSTTRKGQFGPIINQRLHDVFQTEQYPSRAVKENLAEELGITFRQVSRWFETRRHFTRIASAKKGTNVDYNSSEKISSPVGVDMQLEDPEEAVMEKPNVCTNNVENEGMSGNLNEGCKQESVLKKGINCDARGSKGDSAEDPIPGLDLVDEARRKAIQREMMKKKMGR